MIFIRARSREKKILPLDTIPRLFPTHTLQWREFLMFLFHHFPCRKKVLNAWKKVRRRLAGTSHDSVKLARNSKWQFFEGEFVFPSYLPPFPKSTSLPSIELNVMHYVLEERTHVVKICRSREKERYWHCSLESGRDRKECSFDDPIAKLLSVWWSFSYWSCFDRYVQTLEKG